ncbi:sensor histidine kinase [Aquipuribacter nitratireducens]|uniref:histidine kinase n=1 Tax=Aquipuribacter nitratireducens TaxID=650104 RepID=A0ABW0GQM8_9MICO
MTAATSATPGTGVTTTAPSLTEGRRGGAPWAAGATVAVAWGVGLLSLLLLLGGRPPLEQDLLFYVVDLAVALVFGAVAATVLWRRVHVVAVLMGLAAVGGALAALGYGYAQLASVVGGLPGDAVLQRLSGTAWLPGTYGMFLVLPWLVREEGALPGDRAGRAGLAVGAALTVALFTARLLPETPTLLVVQSVLTLAAVVVGLLAAAGCLRRRRALPPGQRAPYVWLALGTAAVALSFVPIALPFLLTVVPLAVVPSLHLASQVLFPGAVMVVVLRRRLWGLDLALSRAVLAGALTAVLVVAYVLVAALVAALLPDAGLAPVVAAGVVVAAVQPSRLWLQRRVDRLVHGDAADPALAVRRLGSRLAAAASTEDLLESLVDGVVAALRLDAVTLVVDGREVVRRGELTPHSVGVPLEHRGAPVGRLVVTPPAGERLDGRARAVLDELAGLVAAGAALTVAARELENAREKVTEARLTERRRLRRELHDGLGPSLAGIRLGIGAARNVVRDDPAAAADLLGALQGELDQRVEDVRTLSRDLLPPALDELGLVPALGELAARHATGGLDVDLDLDDATSALRGALAVTAYGIVVEAVTNVARHSGASRCTVRLRREGEHLRVHVDDDGTGVAEGSLPGVGTSSMRERAEEVGGSLALLARPGGGTRVEAVLPWRA